MIGIYCFTINRSGFYADCPLIYIGQSKDIERRMYEHNLYLSSSGSKYKPVSRAVLSAVKEHGNYTFFVLEECTLPDLDSRENYYLSLCGELQRLGKLQLLNKNSAPRIEYQAENGLALLRKLRTGFTNLVS